MKRDTTSLNISCFLTTPIYLLTRSSSRFTAHRKTKYVHTAARPRFAYFLSSSYQTSALTFSQRSLSVPAYVSVQKLVSVFLLPHCLMRQLSFLPFKLAPSGIAPPGVIPKWLHYYLVFRTPLYHVHWCRRISPANDILHASSII